MDFQARNLAILDFQEFNESVRTRGRSRMHDPRELHFAFPQLPIQALARALLSTARRAIGSAQPLNNLVDDSAPSADVLRRWLRRRRDDQALADRPACSHVRELNTSLPWRLEMPLGGVDRDGQFGRDPRVAQSAPQQHDHLPLPRRLRRSTSSLESLRADPDSRHPSMKLLSVFRVGLARVRWLLPWISVVLVSASVVAYAMNATATISRTPSGGQPLVSVAPAGTDRSAPDAVANGNDARDVGPPCASLFGSYNWWLFSSGRHGPCQMDPDAVSDSPPDR